MSDVSSFVPRVLLTAIVLRVAAVFGLVAPTLAAELVVRLSKETTYLVEPLGKHGLPDYFGVINTRFGTAIEPHRNAVVLLREALGFTDMSADARRRYIAILAGEISPTSRPRFVEWRQFLRENPDDIEDEHKMALRHPWSRNQYPAVYEWLRKCEASLEIAVQASKKDQFFDPLVKDPEFIPSDPERSPATDVLGILKALTARALLRCGEGDPVAASSDLIACHRLIALGRTGATQGLVEPYLDAMRFVFRADKALLIDDRLPARQLDRIRADLTGLPKASSLGTRIGFSDRCLCLDAAIADNRYPMEQAERERGLTLINAYFDRVSAAWELRTYGERCAAAKEIESDLQRIFARTHGVRGSAEILLCVHVSPSVGFLMEWEGRCIIMQSLVEVSCSLESHKRRHGTFPSTLTEIVPEYIKAVPNDVFDGRALKYQRNGDGYLLYSVGKNGVRDDPPSRDNDDIAIERYGRER